VRFFRAPLHREPYGYNTIPAAAGCPAVSINTVRIDPVPIDFPLARQEDSYQFVKIQIQVMQFHSPYLVLWAQFHNANKCGNILVCFQMVQVIYRYYTGGANELGNLQSIVIRVAITSGACLPNVFSDRNYQCYPARRSIGPVAVDKE
jgi:hypothetical protein